MTVFAAIPVLDRTERDDEFEGFVSIDVFLPPIPTPMASFPPPPIPHLHDNPLLSQRQENLKPQF